MSKLRSWVTVCVLAWAAPAIGADQPSGKVQKPTESVPRGGCVTTECHPGIKGKPFAHGPVAVDACDACHVELEPSQHTYQPRFQGKALCQFCHKFQTRGQHVHKPVSQGECTDCHDPHGGVDRFMLLGGVGAASCKQCHKYVTGGLPALHGPVAAGSCTACHRPHSSDYPALLSLPRRELCLECHALLKRQFTELRTLHKPVAEDCGGCHLPHAAGDKMLLKAASPALCSGCHKDLTNLIEAATTKHNAVAVDRGCQNCHDPHGSDYPAILVNDMVEVCLSCHDEEIPLPDGTKLSNIKAVLATGTSLHGPISQRNCVTCHHIHGGSHFRLLLKEYPAAFYAPFLEETYALCLACHDRHRFLAERTNKLTDFRNGDLNLHYLHINKKVKGRTCRACHETHASEKPKHVRVSVPFGSGSWELPVDFDKTATGGGCRPGCHRSYKYDRVNPVAYEVPETRTTAPTSAPTTAPTTREAAQETRKEASYEVEETGS